MHTSHPAYPLLPPLCLKSYTPYNLCSRCHKFSMWQFPQKPAIELFCIIFLVSGPQITISGHKHVCPCGFFYHCHRQTGCWLTATCLSELVHKHINSVTHTLWQQTLDSYGILKCDIYLDQPKSESPFDYLLSAVLTTLIHSQKHLISLEC